MRRALATLLLAVASLFGVAANAAAATVPSIDIPVPSDESCWKVPTPTSPGDGVSGWMDPAPVDPPVGDPFAPNATVSVYSQYGYAGLRPLDFDPGCASVFSWTPLAGAVGGFAYTLTAATTRLSRAVMSGTFGSLFDGVQAALSTVLGEGLFRPLIGLAVAVTGVYLLVQARKGQLAWLSKTAAGSMLIVVAGCAAAFYPITIGAAVDKGMTVAITNANQLLSSTPGNSTDTAADTIASNMYSDLHYQTAMLQTFGMSEEGQKAANEYGHRLIQDKAFNREELAAIAKDPSKEAGMVEAKQNDIKDMARDMKSRYPGAYAHFAGNDSISTFGMAVVDLAGTILSCGFLLYMLVRFAYALVIVRVGIGVAPAVALAAQFPRMNHHAMTLLSAIWTAIVHAVVLGFAAAVYIHVGIGAIMSPTVAWHPVVKLFAMGLITYVMVKLLRKFNLAKKPRIRGLMPSRPGLAPKTAPASRPSAGSPEPSTSPRTAPVSEPKAHRAQAAAKGAATGAAVTIVAGVATGGAVTAAAAAGGAAKGAIGGAATAPKTQKEPAQPVHRVAAVEPPPSKPADPPAPRTAPAGPVGQATVFHPTPGQDMPGPKTAAPSRTVDGVQVHRVTSMGKGQS